MGSCPPKDRVCPTIRGEAIKCGVVVEAEAPVKAVREAKLKPNELTSFNILQAANGNLPTEEWWDHLGAPPAARLDS